MSPPGWMNNCEGDNTIDQTYIEPSAIASTSSIFMGHGVYLCAACSLYTFSCYVPKKILTTVEPYTTYRSLHNTRINTRSGRIYLSNKCIRRSSIYYSFNITGELNHIIIRVAHHIIRGKQVHDSSLFLVAATG